MTQIVYTGIVRTSVACGSALARAVEWGFE